MPTPAIAADLLECQLHSGREASELACPRKDGRMLHVSFSITALLSEQGNLEGKIVAVADITARRESEQEWRS